ncbi:methyl-accepting chemotaxis protein [Clostridium saccharobutylicum]|uniref:Methyl-accepting chemotaxis protein McpC n=1 Tax=Clostridium saccharobutylicum DSM 13864 TaxID=1345695 RepID=U5MZV7_CLOSA|nr:methyl-accepting chemotaxis protein [Clostridium saccharobutylicum]AGX45211.1 methyl-accepting chemotaxis protein McpC [Clostridium saccharobutylicum DSM 13864]AQR92488.1 methyl-accepting chemotaxis protein McpC [Clostridium saccharobutylicum]AQS02391.1 methyl-accepting chemotaxis protein McpC [Clostridium saccharobutylicum]AQS16374.1 methyl-accepting chemotaxis protein McpC [Clostridium saccharobutylicum]MBA2905054.1 methyl-accepting chemotaxis protein [Clostridium saccharobutylicum]
MKLKKIKNGETSKKNIKKLFEFKSIASELIVTIGIIAVLLTGGIILSVSLILSRAYDKQINTNNEMISGLISKNLSSFVNTAYSVTKDLSVNSEILSMDTSTQNKVLKEYQSRNPYFDLIYVQNDSGMQTGRSAGELADRSGRWWYKQLQQTQKPFVSKSFYSATSNKPIASVFMPLYNDNKVIGSIGADLKLDYLQQLVEQYSSKEDGRYSFIIDSEGVVIAHPNSELISEINNYKTLTKTMQVKDANGKIMKDNNGNNVTKEEPIKICDGYKQIVQSVMNGQSGSIKFKDNNESYYASYTPISLNEQSQSWSIVTVQNESNAKVVMKSIINTTLIAGLIILIIAALAMSFLAKKITKPIIIISDLLTKASTGDFTVKFVTDAKNEIGILSSSFNEMIRKISNLLKGTKELTENIKNSAVILTEKSEETTRSANEINTAISEIAIGASNQASDAEKSANLGVNMNEKFVQLTDKTNLMIKDAEISSRVTSEGVNKIEELKDKTKITLEIIEKTENSIVGLNNKSKDIEGILEALEEIAGQTKLLALNASIEAARAGENGKSFGVVAEEIQKLSEESESSTNDIAKIIYDIKNEIVSSANMMKNVKLVSEEQFISVNDVNQSFNKISETTHNITNIINNIGSFVEEMDADNNNVVSSINNIAAISEETAACSEEVTASIEEQTENINEVSIQVRELKEKASILEEEIQKFIIE